MKPIWGDPMIWLYNAKLSLSPVLLTGASSWPLVPQIKEEPIFTLIQSVGTVGLVINSMRTPEETNEWLSLATWGKHLVCFFFSKKK